MLTLAGRTCIFAGATGMIGRGAVKALAEGGMNVVMATHNPESAAEIIASLTGMPGTVIAAGTQEGQKDFYAEIEERFGSIDVVISNTGGFNAPRSVDEITAEDISKKLEHQVTGAWRMVQNALPYLRRSRAGRILLMSSAGAQDGFTGENIADSIARGGVISMTYALARALAPDGITVNCIAKSGVVNDHEPRKPEHYQVNSILERIPLGRIGTNDEFGAAVAYLASEEAAFVTGQVLNLSGGLHIG